MALLGLCNYDCSFAPIILTSKILEVWHHSNVTNGYFLLCSADNYVTMYSKYWLPPISPLHHVHRTVMDSKQIIFYFLFMEPCAPYLEHINITTINKFALQNHACLHWHHHYIPLLPCATIINIGQAYRNLSLTKVVQVHVHVHPSTYACNSQYSSP